MAITLGKRGANSLCFKQTGGNETISNADLRTLTTNQPAGQMLTFLSAVYGSGDLAETAFRNLGGYIVVRATAGTDPVAATFKYGVDGGGLPTLVVALAAADNEFEVKMAADHSITL
jgi:hypothetical protein